MRELDFQELCELRSTEPGSVLVDCRAAEYWLWETIDGSANLRWKEVNDRAAEVLPDKSQLIVTFCQSSLCPSSTKANHSLQALGYTNLYEYFGGVEDWRARGGAIVRSAKHRVSEQSLRFPGQEFFGMEVGAYLIEDDERVVLVDGPQTLTDANEDFILSFDKPITVFLTHGPTGGAAEKLREAHGAEIVLHRADANNPWLTCAPTRWFDSSFALSENLQVIHTPGHSPGSSCLYDSRSKILYSGDHLAGRSSAEVMDFRTEKSAERDFAAQLESLRSVQNLELSAVHPFHYQPIVDDPSAAIGKFLKNMKQSKK